MGYPRGVPAGRLEDTPAFRACLDIPSSCRSLALGSQTPSLTGTIPTEVGLLTNLVDIVLSNNQLTGTMPVDFMQNVGILRELDVSDNRLTGNPMVNFGMFCRGLVRVDLRSNQFSGEVGDTLQECVDLVFFDISENQFSGTIPPSIGNLVSLTRLHLNDNLLDGTIPNTIGRCSMNEQLPGCEDPTLGMGNLQLIQLQNNDLVGTIPSTVASNLDLRTLDVSFNPRVNGSLPDSLASLNNFRNLDADSTGLEGQLTAPLREKFSSIAHRVSLCNTGYTFSRDFNEDGRFTLIDGVTEWHPVPFVTPFFNEGEFVGNETVNNAAVHYVNVSTECPLA
eukprot:CAMPEP_0118924418 /NCGR_PEP_ID=MMETSP1169-20130426/2565_1 /TAXON_ID=36882 /ORGANISM="Pyramimonas obovata, Strain CCMP722" /LENGTH=336 /DNA_ID=CAMNT_0006865531 /DNA_START=248 /DNA_END=1255 /DNA_ORIENTATION=-